MADVRDWMKYAQNADDYDLVGKLQYALAEMGRGNQETRTRKTPNTCEHVQFLTDD